MSQPVAAVTAAEAAAELADAGDKTLRAEARPGLMPPGPMLTQKDGRVELVVAQVNIVPVTAADAGNFDLVARAAVVTISDQNDSTMDPAEIIEALRYAADQLEAEQR